MIKAFYYLFLACRPLTLVVATLPVILGMALAVSQNLFDLPADLLISINTLVVASLIQIISNLANDYFDFKQGSDQKLTNRLKVLPAKLVPPKFFLVFLLNICFLTIILAVPLILIGGKPILFIGIPAIIFAFLYSATKFSLANNYLSELFIFLYFGPIATAGTFYLLTTFWTLPALGIGICSGLLGIALLQVNNLRDYQSDLLNGRKNLVTKFGQETGLVILRSLYLIAPISLLFLGMPKYLICIIPLGLIYAFYLITLTKRASINFKLLFLNTIGLIFLLEITGLVLMGLELIHNYPNLINPVIR